MALPHNIPIAFFEITLIQNTFQVAIKFDVADLENTLKETDFDELQNYITQNSVFFINNKAIKYDFCAIEKDKEHYFIYAELKETPPPLIQYDFTPSVY